MSERFIIVIFAYALLEHHLKPMNLRGPAPELLLLFPDDQPMQLFELTILGYGRRLS
jgi:hypothetical protein